MTLPSAGVAFIVLPLIGRAMGKGVPPHIMVVAGFLIVAGFAWMVGNMNLAAGSDDFFWPIILRAIGLSLTIVHSPS